MVRAQTVETVELELLLLFQVQKFTMLVAVVVVRLVEPLVLVVQEVAEPSLPGIIIAAASIVAMPLLTWQKYRVGKRIGSRALVADSRETLACGLLSVALLIGLGANHLFGLWQADPVVGLVITAFLFREGWENWREGEESATPAGER